MVDDSTLRRVDALSDARERSSLLIYSRDHTQVVQMSADRPTVIGRLRPADVAIPDMSISRQHARFELDAEGVWVEDLGSTNGTFVNGERIAGRSKLKPGDKVAVGTAIVTLHVMRDAADGEEVPGLDSHERLMTHLEHEVNQARYFGRKLALLMVQSPVGDHVVTWAPKLRPELRPVDRVGLYGPNAALVVLPGLDAEAAIALAGRMAAASRRDDGRRLLFGVAIFPTGAASAEELIEVSRSAARHATEARPVHCPREGLAPLEGQAPVVHSPALQEVFATVDRLARATIPVLIYGATGTGKEVVARAIHERSERRKKPLRCINCGAIPSSLIESALFGHERGAFTGADRQVKGVFEEAEGGSVLLDEIGELSPQAQAALLRVLETKRICRVGSSRELAVDVRILAATHRDLDEMCRAGRFRLDLLYRLNAMTVRIPSLRERPEDIVPLADHFLRQASRESGRTVRAISARALDLLCSYGWPGNVRELRNVIERAVVVSQGELITELDLSDRIRTPDARMDAHSTKEIALLAEDEADEPEEDVDFKDRVRQFETELILEALRASGGNQTEAARRLRMPLRTLVHKLKAYGIKAKAANPT
jgi:DNA-binding NtrC family response regulator/pSer/pThr/pTyr-binding forkhead associated (FHA) protein